MTGLWITLGILGGLVLIFCLWMIIARNNFVRLKNNVDEAFSTMDIYLKKRYDLIPNIVETVKGYAKHEKETLTAVISARNMAISATNSTEKAKAEGEIGRALKSLFKLSEAYPELRANANFIDLQNQLKSIETEIATSRRYYNACVKQFNTKIDIFPSSLIAKWFKFEKRAMFEVESAEERQNVKVKF